MKVVHLESGRHLYGGARQVAYLLAGLAEQHVDNVLVCRPGAELGRADPAARIVELPWHGDLDWGAVRRLRALLRRERPDLLHVHSRAGADWYGSLAARAERVPMLLTRRVDQREPAFWARMKFGRCAAIAAISRPIRHWLVDELGLDAARVALIPSAVDARGFAEHASARAALERRFGLGPVHQLVGAVGQLIARKGHDLLLAAMPRIRAQQPNARLLVFGRGPEQPALVAAIRRAGLGDCVVLAGYEPALGRFLAGLDLLVHPARAEGLGLAVLEALACGVPVVAGRAGGLVDLIDDGCNGVLVPPGDVAALAAAVAALLGDPARQRALTERGRARVRARHSPAGMARAYRALYREVLAEHGRRAV